jgi:hypothetical protein
LLSFPETFIYNRDILHRLQQPDLHGGYPRFQSAGKKVAFVDQYFNFVDSKGNILTSQFGNYEHPSTIGYASMGHTWFNAMTPVPEPSAIFYFGTGAVILLALVWFGDGGSTERERVFSPPLDRHSCLSLCPRYHILSNLKSQISNYSLLPLISDL